MKRTWRSVAVAGALAAGTSGGDAALAQKSGGILKLYTIDSPASVSILEENTVFAERPVMGVFNNLVMFDQHVEQNALTAIVPDLAERWSWDADHLRLSFTLRQGVTWHDGKPFTAADVKCTWDLLQGKAPEKLRVNPRRVWYRNLEDVTTAGDFAVTFRLKRPQPAFLALLASGYSPIYPCHVAPKEMRRHPIGTGPFKFVAFKPNESIKLTRNPNYWKPGLPYLDGIEWTIIRNRSTAILAFIAGKVDVTSPYDVPFALLRDVRSQAPQAVCKLTPTNVSRNLIVNRDKPPFDNPDLRRAMALTLDRKAFLDIITEGQGDVGGVMQPPPEGLWGMQAARLESLPGYGSDVQRNRAEARAIMAKLGYGPAKRLAIKLLTRDIPPYRDPAVILIDQLKEIYIDAEFDPIDTTVWYPKIMRKDYSVALNLTGSGLDDPDQNLYAGYTCGSEENYNGYCNPEVDRLIDQQSMEADPERRQELVWAIERKLAEDDARPIIFYVRAGTCWQPAVKNMTIMVNSIYNGWRMEDVWLDR